MLYIIGGVSRAGKSTVCRLLATKYNLPYLSFDVLMSALIDTGNFLDINYKADSAEIAMKMWPFTSSTLSHLDEHSGDYIVEGISFWPTLLTTLPEAIEYRACFLGMKKINPTIKLSELRKNSDGPNSWQNEFVDSELINHLENIAGISLRLFKDCKKSGMAYLDSESDFEKLFHDVDEKLFAGRKVGI